MMTPSERPGKVRLAKFAKAKNWEWFDLRQLGAGVSGYTESVFDGRYVYFGTERNEEGAHSLLLRFDNTREFTSVAAWTVFDASRVSGTKGSYVGLAFDGRYVYYTPFRGGRGLEVELFQTMLRYDTRMEFADPGAWLHFDLRSIDADFGGFVGALYFRDALYAAPYYSGDRSLFLKFDGKGDFRDPVSWTQFDAMTIRPDAKGYMGVETDGRYLYFSPCYNSKTGKTNTVMARFDGDKPFTDPSAWEFFDLAAEVDNPSLGGYHGSMSFDGRYIYYTPLYAPMPCEIETMHHGWFVRFDTTRTFGDSASWETFNSRLLGQDVCGYTGAGYDGRFVYFNPMRCCSHEMHGRMLRFDTSYASLSDPKAYEIFDVKALDSRLAYFDGKNAFDGTYMYFSGASSNDMMLRFRTRVKKGLLWPLF